LLERLTRAVFCGVAWLGVTQMVGCDMSARRGSGAGPALAVAASASPMPPMLPASEWQEKTLVDHPLVGRIYQPMRPGGFATRRDLEQAVRRARVVLLGEKHDNRDHHRLEAALLSEVIPLRRDLAVAFEMLDLDQQPAVDRFLSTHPLEVDGLAQAVNWDASGWPPWSMYRPVFAVALGGHARIVAANLSRESTSAIARGAEASLATSLPPLSPARLRALEEDMRESHCGLLPEPMLPGMVLAQRARDFTIAQRMREADRGDGVVLFAGAGHVRRDRGVPVYLGAAGIAGVISIAFLEVVRGESDPHAYLSDAEPGVAPFDFVWFTPRVDEQDPCEELRHSHR
jgi:uncharacterized iron-regulated protein